MTEKEKPQQPPVYIGIDLGTTYCSVAKYENNKLETIEFNGTSTIPSRVYYGEFNSVGYQAQQQMKFKDKIKNVVYDSKRMLGKSYDQIKEDIPNWTFDVIEKDSKPVIKLDGDREIFPYQVSATILDYLRQQLEKKGIPLDNVIITVPANFDEAETTDVRNAIKIAKFPHPEKVTLIKEPSAASICFVHTASTANARALIYDFGGGTFDLSLVEIKGTTIEVKDNHGDPHLGGRDIDNKIVDLVVQKIKQQYSIDDQEIENIKYSILEEAEKTKKVFSPSFRIQKISIQSTAKEILEVTMTCREFEQILDPLVDKTIALVEEILKRNGGIDKLDNIILVGGSSLIYYVRDKLEEKFEGKILDSVNPLNAVALGAAYKSYLEFKPKKVSAPVLCVDPQPAAPTPQAPPPNVGPTPQPNQFNAAITPQPNQFDATTTPQPNQFNAAITPQPNQFDATTTPQTNQFNAAITSQPNQFNATTTPQPNQFNAAITSQPNQFDATTTPQTNQFNAAITSQPNQFDATTTPQTNQFNAAITSQPNQFDATTTPQTNQFNAAITSQPNQFDATTTPQTNQFNAAITPQPNQFNAAITPQPNQFNAAPTSQASKEIQRTTSTNAVGNQQQSAPRYSGIVRANSTNSVGSSQSTPPDAEAPTNEIVQYDCVSISYGLRIRQERYYKFYPMIKKGTRLPAGPVKKTFKTVDDYVDSIDLRIFQGNEQDIEKCKEIGKYLITGLEKKKKGEEHVEITFMVDEQNILHLYHSIKGKENDAHEEKYNLTELENKHATLTNEQIEQARSITGMDKKDPENELQELEDVFTEYRSKVRGGKYPEALKEVKSIIDVIIDAYNIEDTKEKIEKIEEIKKKKEKFVEQYREIIEN
ncbi:dnaK protein [Trichomonas vaginalis G3]|uniref:DnaK protein n=1 Tax=Trichomonas vaginalis (strain ATCC PRA-98 / G3) TaxID=412133 RepID=A2DJE0_TRIV3|nr:ATP binding [Trichomonas vaginalis G3]EAY19527.1 dnaK protein [Trichomonas vaginalis G3]KAI5519991.1 ATP binding [Trichomonas vaginalis G3]|eukprot:XP_001580513.1 dnaK protein [Trichomonas vaginalis G3]